MSARENTREPATRWSGCNRVRLLENGEEFFPAVFDAIKAAQKEVILETFILFEDKVGKALHEVLLAAAQRGVQVDVMVDDFGSPDLSEEFTSSLVQAGVRFRVFSPSSRWFGVRMNILRRMHRKIVVVDGRLAFVGGINYSADHLADFGPEAKQDYSIEIEGPVVNEIHRFARSAIAPRGEQAQKRRWFQRRAKFEDELPAHQKPGECEALFVTRDNDQHRDDIERHYRAAIRAARKRVLIANAYFFPGFRLLRQIRRAARRGVEVTLILQGQPDTPLVRTAGLLYDNLLKSGVRIFEYCERPLHGKVAVIDGEWATVGSSNLDPLSLALNLEANVMVRNPAFAKQLAGRLEHLVAHSCKEIQPQTKGSWRVWGQVLSFFVFHFTRHFPAWAERLPSHTNELQSLHAERAVPQGSQAG